MRLRDVLAIMAVEGIIIFTLLYFFCYPAQARDSVELEKYRVEAYRDILQTKIIQEGK